MRRKITRFLLALTGLTLLSLGLWYWESIPSHEESQKSRTQRLFTPLVEAVSWVAEGMVVGLEYVVTSGMVRKENALLKEQAAQLRMENAVLREAVARYENLQAGALLAEMRQWRLIPANVIALSGKTWARGHMLDIGSRQEVQEGDPVLDSDGLVGVIIRVTPRSSIMQLLNDARTNIGVMVLPERLRGVVKGTSKKDELELTLDLPTNTLKSGLAVVTSGMEDSLYPRGLPVGEVVSQKNNIFGQTVYTLRPYSRLQGLWEVLVLLTEPTSDADTPPSLSLNPAPAQQEKEE